MLLLLTVLFPTLLFVGNAADVVTSDFLHKYLHFLLQSYCLDVLFTAVSH